MLQSEPVSHTQMLIRRPIAEVFAAFVDPEITSKFWFSRGDRRLQQGQSVTWYWDMYGVSAAVQVKEIEENRRILIEWPNPVEWTFSPRGDEATFVVIREYGFDGTDDDKVARALDSVGGFTLALVGCKAYLEHGIELNLVADHNPDGLV